MNIPYVDFHHRGGNDHEKDKKNTQEDQPEKNVTPGRATAERKNWVKIK